MIETQVPTRRLLDVAEVAYTLNLGRTRVYELLASGQIRSVHIGARRLVPAEAIDEYVARLTADAR